MKKMKLIKAVFAVIFCSGLIVSAQSSGSLLVYAGAASKPPTEEAARIFEQKTGLKIEVIFGGGRLYSFSDEIVKTGRSLFSWLVRLYGES